MRSKGPPSTDRQPTCRLRGKAFMPQSEPASHLDSIAGSGSCELVALSIYLPMPDRAASAFAISASGSSINPAATSLSTA